ncbi:hypothetical protein XA68_10731 [Ophiocordyceps unilateralis]|uniref:Uncharacterized protein n=1 Tax=Ophiocordyceps unilateralis TaxID=268505 RepID=A0A2A9PQP0_OPHUN|nr:hypothetical protein XA68_10731 [Ophiocordyceps unilateralis]
MAERGEMSALSLALYQASFSADFDQEHGPKDETYQKSSLSETRIALAALDQSTQPVDKPRRKSRRPKGKNRCQGVKPLVLAERLLNMREKELIKEHAASMPCHQFRCQVEIETRSRFPIEDDTFIKPEESHVQYATDAVKQRWIEQGIWRSSWDVFNLPGNEWKHEQPIETECLSDVESEAEAEHGSRPREAEYEQSIRGMETVRRVTERQMERQRRREASRPIHQFVHQLSRERERLLSLSEADRSPAGYANEIHIVAFDNLKNTWTKYGLWDQTWGLLPGNSWKHERPLQDFLANDAAYSEARRLVERSHTEAKETPVKTTDHLSPGESSHAQRMTAIHHPSTPVSSRRVPYGYSNSSSEEPSSRSRSRRTQDSPTAMQRPLSDVEAMLREITFGASPGRSYRVSKPRKQQEVDSRGPRTPTKELNIYPRQRKPLGELDARLFALCDDYESSLPAPGVGLTAMNSVQSRQRNTLENLPFEPDTSSRPFRTGTPMRLSRPAYGQHPEHLTPSGPSNPYRETNSLRREAVHNRRRQNMSNHPELARDRVARLAALGRPSMGAAPDLVHTWLSGLDTGPFE